METILMNKENGKTGVLYRLLFNLDEKVSPRKW